MTHLGDTVMWTDGEYAIVHVVRPFGSGYVCYRKVDYPNPEYNFQRFMPDSTMCFTNHEVAHLFIDTQRQKEERKEPHP